MNISSACSTPPAASTQLAPDGDTAAVEAQETRAAKQAEAQNGGVAPKPATATAATAPTSNSVLNQIA